MKLTQLGLGSNRLQNVDELYPAQDILMQTGQLLQYGTGIYAYGNVPLKVKCRIENVLRETLEKYGCVEIQLPILQQESLWQESARWERYTSDGTMFVVETEKGKYGLAPTAEEAVVAFARNKLKSYKDLPVTIYQIGEKYRNEIRTRGYLMRGKCFPMMDAYSFGRNQNDLSEAYSVMKKAYLEFFSKLRLEVLPVAADSGAIGGKKSEEFMALTSIGEDTILYNSATKQGVNIEILERDDCNAYLKEEYNINDVSELKEEKATELGHIFQLGTKYSIPMGGNYVDNNGVEMPYVMGCYGIGITRVMATIYEQSILRDKNDVPTGIALPSNLAPYILQIIPKKDSKEKMAEAEEIYRNLCAQNIPAIFDDRAEGMLGADMKDAKILGTPYLGILGAKTTKGEIEIEESATGKKKIVSQQKLLEILVKFNKNRFASDVSLFDLVENAKEIV